MGNEKVNDMKNTLLNKEYYNTFVNPSVQRLGVELDTHGLERIWIIKGYLDVMEKELKPLYELINKGEC